MGKKKLLKKNGEQIKKCQSCNSKKIKKFLSLGKLPIANDLYEIKLNQRKQILYPTELFFCNNCLLVQLGFIIKPEIVFPKDFPYTSSTTKALSDNFEELSKECMSKIKINKKDLILDIGSNDGNLLSYFQKYSKVLGVTPENVGKKAIKRGIPTIINYFNSKVAKKIVKNFGKAKVITSTNTFAHIPDVNEVVELVLKVLKNNGIFITESHYIYNLLKTFQFDTIYHEHLRYYSLHSLKYILERNGLEIFDVKEIPSHGGSIRVYSAIKGSQKINKKVNYILNKEKKSIVSLKNMELFKKKVEKKRKKIQNLLKKIKNKGNKIYGIGAAARASTLINYTGIKNYIDAVLEVKGSKKIGFLMSGTKIPIYEESILFKKQPEYLLLLSWHIADMLIPKLKKKGYKGKFIVPLPDPYII